ncbi:MAG: class I SAM-dependent methyltransferase [Melioribacteraceae bacterium]|nr:class I SAM-dependent methyltransferase [Melioribacteraceae bacterium]MCF8357045.1 class I SAM-dependent methyltransferase [Melioribacteraceae bacterium]MCF8396480.1 class I SAM-dependent methyltransferase [Melioribacteraceae bacterium]
MFIHGVRSSEFIDVNYKIAADIGCGSGIDSIAISRHGLNVDGFDPSQKMILTAKKNSRNFNVSPNFYNIGITEIGEDFHDKYDLIVSLGNAMANIPPVDLKNGIRDIKRCLKQNGRIIIQLLNYENILAREERIVNITKGEKQTHIRFYDIYPTEIKFNILSFHNDDPRDRKLISTNIYPHTPAFFEESLKETGIKNVKFYGDLKLNPYKKESSPNLVIITD